MLSKKNIIYLLFTKYCDILCMYLFGGVGEVVNTADCGSVMQGFDSLIPPHFKKESCLGNFFAFLGTFSYALIILYYNYGSLTIPIESKYLQNILHIFVKYKSSTFV